MMSNLDVSDSGEQACYPGAQGSMYGASQQQQQQPQPVAQSSGEAAHVAYPSSAPTLSPKENALAEMSAHVPGPVHRMQQVHSAVCRTSLVPFPSLNIRPDAERAAASL